ncbi:MAG TPA: hypothetical protein VNX68_13830, partial [Nitrosopumilaceae archaeon]|nr:hypothetical protein [Nitrosopumilaceae archaeon]
MNGEEIHIDFFDVIKGTNIVLQFFHGGILYVTQTMSAETASIFASALASDHSGIYSMAANELITFTILKNNDNILLSVDSLATNIGKTHMEIDYLFENKVELRQRTSIGTIKAI